MLFGRGWLTDKQCDDQRPHDHHAAADLMLLDANVLAQRGADANVLGQRGADANVLGRPIRIAGRHFDRGLGVQTESVMLFDLAGQYREFVTWLGVDDSGGPLSDVTAEVRVDGETVFRIEHPRVAGRG